MSATTAAVTPEAATADSGWHTIRRGFALLPDLRRGLLVTVALAVLATLGRVVVPFAVQRVIDHGLAVDGGPDVDAVVRYVGLAALAVLLTALAAYGTSVRLFRVGEGALAHLRTRAFRHIHDLSMLHQQSQRRGSLVSRITGDVDQISQFLQWGGLLLLVSFCQLTLATAVMAMYSWQLTMLVYMCFLPLMLLARRFQRQLAGAYGRVRERAGEMLSAVSETVVGAQVVRAYGVRDRTAARVETAINEFRHEQTRAQRLSVFAFSAGEIAAGLANAAIVVAGVALGVDGDITLGELTAFLFLITLFIGPVQVSTEVLNEAQNAIAGFRRVLGVIDTEPDVADPGPHGVDLPPGPLGIEFANVGFAYPGGPPVLHDVTVTVAPRSRVAVVGETGSGKTTFAKLLTRLMDPVEGSVFVGGVPLRDVRFSSLRERVVMVPQDGFLFDATIADNVRFGRSNASDDDVAAAFTALGLGDWLAGLPDGVATRVGERGESLSVGERQLVAIARAYVADPDVLVLDEATSSVDPATEVRLRGALDALTTGRTTVAIAHRLATAETADEVLVFDAGRIVQRGPHAELVREADSVYGRLHASWISQTR